jgi:hypothetical protein
MLLIIWIIDKIASFNFVMQAQVYLVYDVASYVVIALAFKI